jgi:putative glutamine amidotransferase
MNKKQLKLKHYTVGSYDDGDWINCSSKTYNYNKADIIIFPGGIDVSPTLYGEKRGSHTQVSQMSERDKTEIEMYNKALKDGKFIFGICRGLQLLTVLNGGKLVQHMNHPSFHECKTYDGNTCSTNSLHHQLAYPWELPKDKREIFMWSEGLSNTFLNGENNEVNFPMEAFTENGYIIEPEGIWFPDTRCMGVQWHPELMGYKYLDWSWNISNDEQINPMDFLNKLLENLFENPNYIKEQKLILLNNEN